MWPNKKRERYVDTGQKQMLLSYIWTDTILYTCSCVPVADSPSADVVWPGCILGSPGRLVSGKPQRGSGYRFQ